MDTVHTIIFLKLTKIIQFLIQVPD